MSVQIPESGEKVVEDPPPAARTKSEPSPIDDFKAETPPEDGIKTEIPLIVGIKAETPPTESLKVETPPTDGVKAEPAEDKLSGLFEPLSIKAPSSTGTARICLRCGETAIHSYKNWFCWADDIGIDSSNPTCWCGGSSRQARMGKKDTGRYGLGFRTCADGVCGYWSEDVGGGEDPSEVRAFQPWLL